MIDHGQWTCVPGQPPWQINRHKSKQHFIISDATTKSNSNNPYHALSDNDQPELQKLILPDGSIIVNSLPLKTYLKDNTNLSKVLAGEKITAI